HVAHVCGGRCGVQCWRLVHVGRLESEMVRSLTSATSAQGRLKITFWLDVALLVSVCVLQTVSFTGLWLHEWLGLATVGMSLAHLRFAWCSIARQIRRFVARQSARERINYLLNLSLFAVVTAVIYSGVVISQKAIPTLTAKNAAPDMDWRWDVLHNRFSDAVVLLSAFHLAINWEWVLAAGQRLLFPSLEHIRERLRRFREGAL